MDALVFDLKKNKLTLEKLPIPKVVEPTDVLVHLAYVWISDINIHLLQSNTPYNQTDAFSLGHQLCGTVKDVGSSVRSLKNGDKVVSYPYRNCKTCNFCHAGNPQFCRTRCVTDPTEALKSVSWAEYVIVSHDQIYVVSPKVTLEQAALCQSLSSIVHAYDQMSPLPIGTKLLITGAGITGSLWAATLHHLGHRDVTVWDTTVHRLAQLETLATGFQFLNYEDLRKRQNESDDSFDVVIECTGKSKVAENAYELLGDGGTLCISGSPTPNDKMQVRPFDVFWRETRIIGGKINPYAFPRAMELIEALGERHLECDKLGIKVFPLKDYQIAAEYLKKNPSSKAMLKMQ